MEEKPSENVDTSKEHDQKGEKKHKKFLTSQSLDEINNQKAGEDKNESYQKNLKIFEQMLLQTDPKQKF